MLLADEVRTIESCASASMEPGLESHVDNVLNFIRNKVTVTCDYESCLVHTLSLEMRMFENVRELNRQFIDLWEECEAREDQLPELASTYTARAQTQNEKHLLQFLDQVDGMLANPPRSREEAQAAQLRLAPAFRSLAEQTLGFSSEQLDLLPARAFSDASEEFVRMGRAFDPSLSGEDLYQAGRNAWTAHGLQWLSGRTVQLTPSILAYSLLYPYTDNYLDDPEIPRGAKLAFNERFRRRLAGESLTPVNAREQLIFDLVAMIETQYSRSDHSEVFESLLAIHHAQSLSLKLLRRAAAPEEVDVPGLSFYKGGTSVLVDGYLASDSLTEEQRRYTYGHGIFAQLLDDMEDVEQDRLADRLTVYSQSAGHRPLDRLANRTFHFGRQVLRQMDCFDVAGPARELIRHGADLFLIDAIGRTERYYTPAYLRELEAHSPFRFSFLKGQRSRFFRWHTSLGNLMETSLTYLYAGKVPSPQRTRSPQRF